MKTYKNFAICGLTMLALTACVGGGGGDNSVDNAAPLTFREQIGVASQFADEVRTLEAVNANQLPTAGSVTYQGNLGVSLRAGMPDALVVYGDLALTSNFGTNAVTGNVSDIVDSSDRLYAGQLQLTNGQIDRNATANSLLTADLAGTVTASDGSSLAPDATLTGGFLGAGASHVSGTVSGTVQVDTTTVAIDAGSFQAKR